MYKITEVCTPTKVDKNSNLKLFSVFQMMNDCDDMWLDSEPVAKQCFLSEHRAQLLASRQVEVVRVPKLKEKLSVETSVFECKELYGFRNDVIRDEKGEPCYISWSMGAFIDMESGKLKKLPESVINSLKYDEKLPMEYKERRIHLPKKEMTALPAVAVTRNDIDYNRHMNNSHYIRIALEQLPEQFSPQSIRIEYKIPAKLGDRLTPHIVEDGAIYYMTLESENGICAIIEFA